MSLVRKDDGSSAIEVLIVREAGEVDAGVFKCQAGSV